MYARKDAFKATTPPLIQQAFSLQNYSADCQLKLGQHHSASSPSLSLSLHLPLYILIFPSLTPALPLYLLLSPPLCPSAPLSLSPALSLSLSLSLTLSLSLSRSLPVSPVHQVSKVASRRIQVSHLCIIHYHYSCHPVTRQYIWVQGQEMKCWYKGAREATVVKWHYLSSLKFNQHCHGPHATLTQTTPFQWLHCGIFWRLYLYRYISLYISIYIYIDIYIYIISLSVSPLDLYELFLSLPCSSPSQFFGADKELKIFQKCSALPTFHNRFKNYFTAALKNGCNQTRFTSYWCKI